MTEARKADTPLHDTPVEVRNVAGSGLFLLVCEHASNFIPPEYATLGLDGAALESHIAWDPGALAVADEMARLLDAPLVAARVSRLVYDCNRPPESPSAMPTESEIYRIPGNAGLTDAARQARTQAVYVPFREALARAIDAHGARCGPPAIVTVHSFTPVWRGAARAVEIGILHDDDAGLADATLRAAGDGGGFLVRRNEPYGPQDGVTHTLREHALPRGLANVMIEIRNDLIRTPDDVRTMAGRLAGWLVAARAEAGGGNARERDMPGKDISGKDMARG
ncbi:MAG: N-formylglutamate amidohydrolase [Aquamicrobium sp.]|uniref:N-formylglutamate amidohydrolase n=1 Tax=Aquamicrobium sp. TaxID=1872579 RepID=UPI00349E8094|nr:N-formylglutamate amidohydrolase [Aquamicrobium sp.]